MKKLFTLAMVATAFFAHGETTPKKEAPKNTETAEESVKDKGSVKEGPSTDGPPVAAVSSIEVDDIQGFEHYAPQIQELIRKSLALTTQNLTYTFGSADPKNGGMDCSGTIYYVLHNFGFKGVPRQSNEMAGWVQDKTLLHRVNGADSLTHPEFSSLQPGNLLFWSGTYDAGPREIPVTHVMLYLGKLKKSGKHVVFGASDGRAYQGKRRTGVSVFDFSLPRSTSSASFYGYGMIPGVGKIEAKPEPAVAKVEAPKAEPPAAATEAKKTAVADAKPEAKKMPAPETHTEAKKTEVTQSQTEDSSKTEPAVADKTMTAKKDEEIRPAIPVRKNEVAPANPTMATASATADEKPASVKPAAEKPMKAQTASASKPATTSTKTVSKTTASKPKVVAKRKPAPPPPTPMGRVKQATSSFFKDVKKAMPDLSSR